MKDKRTSWPSREEKYITPHTLSAVAEEDRDRDRDYLPKLRL